MNSYWTDRHGTYRASLRRPATWRVSRRALALLAAAILAVIVFVALASLVSAHTDDPPRRRPAAACRVDPVTARCVLVARPVYPRRRP